MTFEVGQGVSGINPQGFMPRYGNEANFSCFLIFQTLKCSISQNVSAKPCGFIRGIHVLLLNVPEKFHYLSPKHLNVTRYPPFATFQKIDYFFIQIKVVQKRLVTESFFIFVDIFQYFRETSNLFLPSCLPANRCYSPSNTTWFGHFLPTNGTIRLSCTAVSLEK